MELKEGMYVRFEGVITKVLEIEDNYISFDSDFYDHWNELTNAMNYNRFIDDYKPVFSYNIIDLIHVGDYVNGLLVVDKYYDYANKEWRLNDRDGLICTEKNIKSILTKEGFDLVKYTVAYD